MGSCAATHQHGWLGCAQTPKRPGAPTSAPDLRRTAGSGSPVSAAAVAGSRMPTARPALSWPSVRRPAACRHLGVAPRQPWESGSPLAGAATGRVVAAAAPPSETSGPASSMDQLSHPRSVPCPLRAIVGPRDHKGSGQRKLQVGWGRASCGEPVRHREAPPSATGLGSHRGAGHRRRPSTGALWGSPVAGGGRGRHCVGVRAVGWGLPRADETSWARSAAVRCAHPPTTRRPTTHPPAPALSSARPARWAGPRAAARE